MSRRAGFEARICVVTCARTQFCVRDPATLDDRRPSAQQRDDVSDGIDAGIVPISGVTGAVREAS